jgi:GNAT superfamily N-acetyltransferase
MRVADLGFQDRIYSSFPALLQEHEQPVNFDRPRLHFVPVTDRRTRAVFDVSLDLIHYAGRCQRVGRCLRLCAYEGRVWVGGVVLGSTFPNIDVRDESLGLKNFVRGSALRGIPHPWHSRNREYWTALQYVVNHARTFVFPRFQGRGLGIATHRELLRTGISHWERRYQQKVAALDTLCTHNDSKLFMENHWRLVGNTRGYTSDPSQVFSKTAFVNDWKNIRNNVALKRIPRGKFRWWVWVVTVDRALLQDILDGAIPKGPDPAISGAWRRALRMI